MPNGYYIDAVVYIYIYIIHYTYTYTHTYTYTYESNSLPIVCLTCRMDRLVRALDIAAEMTLRPNCRFPSCHYFLVLCIILFIEQGHYALTVAPRRVPACIQLYLHRNKQHYTLTVASYCVHLLRHYLMQAYVAMREPWPNGSKATYTYRYRYRYTYTYTYT